ncbi:MAG: hypothetical protein OSA85_02265 [Psychrobacter pacificensis]|nr:hypothetical protein [Psychrobacter pacificensis]
MPRAFFVRLIRKGCIVRTITACDSVVVVPLLIVAPTLNCGVSCEKYCHNKVLNKDYSVQLSAATNLSHEQVSGECYA